MAKILALVLLFLVASAAVYALVEWAVRLARARRFLVAGVAAVTYALVLVLRPDPQILGGLAGLVAAGLGGAILGASLLPDRRGLLAFLVAASIADVASVTFGPTRELAEAAGAGTSDLIFYLAVLLPWEGRLIPALGVSDLFGLAAVFASLRQQGFSGAVAFGCGTAGLVMALAGGLILGGAPGYPFLLLAVVALLTARWWRGRSRGS